METNETTPESGSSKDFVPIPEASDADLDAFLENAPDEPEEIKEQGTETSEAEEENTTQTSETSDEPETEEEAKPKKEAPASEKTPEETQEVSKAQHEEVLRRLEHQERLNQRRLNEIGYLKRKLSEHKQKLEEGIDERFESSPRRGAEDLQKIQEIERTHKALEEEESYITKVQEQQRIVAQHVDPSDVSMDEMAQSLRDDGLDERTVNGFLSNPYQVADAATIIQLAKRSRAEALVKRLVPALKKALAENAELKKKPEKVLNKVQQALRASPSINASQGGGGASKAPRNSNPAQWSDADLNEFLENSNR